MGDVAQGYPLEGTVSERQSDRVGADHLRVLTGSRRVYARGWNAGVRQQAHQCAAAATDVEHRGRSQLDQPPREAIEQSLPLARYAHGPVLRKMRQTAVNVDKYRLPSLPSMISRGLLAVPVATSWPKTSSLLMFTGGVPSIRKR